MERINVAVVLKNDYDMYPFVVELIEKYEKLGPLLGISLPFIEAFFPFLPLFAFVMANSVTYGLWTGFFYSWLGASLGAVAVFFLVRILKRVNWINRLSNNKKAVKISTFINERGFSLLFLLFCFPFSPSSIINIVAAFSTINWQTFLLAVLLGKAVMIFSIAYVGISIVTFVQNPLETIVITLFIGIFWLFGKMFEKRLIHLKKE